VDDNAEFPAAFNTWEGPTIEQELRAAPHAWLRNPPRKDWAVCVPYTLAGEVRGCYPDFVIFHRVGSGVRVRIVDPHSLHLPDAAARAAGLAHYADKHAPAFDAIEMVIVDGKRQLRLDLTQEEIRTHVREVKDAGHLRALFTLLPSSELSAT
jgi:type III restriction enzyme